MMVDAYRNLNDDCISLRRRDDGIVARHTQEARIDEPVFVVQPAGRERVRQEGRKNVHAFVRGELTDTEPPSGAPTPVTYNPYEHESFVRRDGGPVAVADFAVVTTNGVLAWGVE